MLRRRRIVGIALALLVGAAAAAEPQLVVTGLGIAQSHPAPGDRPRWLDMSNAQLIVERTAGALQGYAQAGVYSIPVVGAPYMRALDTTRDLYGPLPVAHVTLAPREGFSLRAGKLPTIIGPEPTFTFQNMNIERGILWNQEPAVSRGAQADYATGPLAFSVSLNDGFYSGHYKWLVGAATWNIDGANSLTLLASGHVGSATYVNDIATPLPLNNGQIYNAIYAHTAGAWQLTAYLQAIHVPANDALGFRRGAQSYGGALLASYRYTESFTLAGRAELVTSTGGDGAPDVLYGAGSTALSLTLTPTWRYGRFLLRAEPSLVRASHIAAGRAFGADGNATSQARLLVETGLLF